MPILEALLFYLKRKIFNFAPLLFFIKPKTESTPIGCESQYEEWWISKAKRKSTNISISAGDHTNCTLMLWLTQLGCFGNCNWQTRTVLVIADKKLNQHCVAFEIFPVASFAH